MMRKKVNKKQIRDAEMRRKKRKKKAIIAACRKQRAPPSATSPLGLHQKHLTLLEDEV